MRLLAIPVLALASLVDAGPLAYRVPEGPFAYRVEFRTTPLGRKVHHVVDYTFVPIPGTEPPELEVSLTGRSNAVRIEPTRARFQLPPEGKPRFLWSTRNDEVNGSLVLFLQVLFPSLAGSTVGSGARWQVPARLHTPKLPVPCAFSAMPVELRFDDRGPADGPGGRPMMKLGLAMAGSAPVPGTIPTEHSLETAGEAFFDAGRGRLAGFSTRGTVQVRIPALGGQVFPVAIRTELTEIEPGTPLPETLDELGTGDPALVKLVELVGALD